MAAESDNYRRLMKERFEAEERKRPGVKFFDGDVRQASQMILHGTGTGGRDAGGFSTFVVCIRDRVNKVIMLTGSKQKGGAAPGRAKPQENKNARIAQDQLLDKLFACFKEYRYWSLKALKDRLQQPESYLKDTLGKIAELVKSGPFALNYKLRPEYEEKRFDLAKQEMAPDDGEPGAESSSSGEDPDGDDDQMDDAL